MADWCSAHAVTVDEVYALEELFKNLSSSLHQVRCGHTMHSCLLLHMLVSQVRLSPAAQCSKAGPVI